MNITIEVLETIGLAPGKWKSHSTGDYRMWRAKLDGYMVISVTEYEACEGGSYAGYEVAPTVAGFSIETVHDLVCTVFRRYGSDAANSFIEYLKSKHMYPGQKDIPDNHTAEQGAAALTNAANDFLARSTAGQVENQDFAVAMAAAIRDKLRVRRAAWAQDAFIVMMPELQLPPYSTQGTERKVNDRTAKWIGEETPLNCRPYFARYKWGQWQPGWVPDQADMFAEDWIILH